jgi:hypothetical protein
MVAVLGEVPDQDGAMRALRRASSRPAGSWSASWSWPGIRTWSRRRPARPRRARRPRVRAPGRASVRLLRSAAAERHHTAVGRTPPRPGSPHQGTIAHAPGARVTVAADDLRARRSTTPMLLLAWWSSRQSTPVRALAAPPQQARARPRARRPHPMLKRVRGVSLHAPPPARITEPGLRHTPLPLGGEVPAQRQDVPLGVPPAGSRDGGP